MFLVIRVTNFLFILLTDILIILNVNKLERLKKLYLLKNKIKYSLIKDPSETSSLEYI